MSFRISVALPLPIDRTFSYLCPSELKERARPGCRAVVPLGRRILTGVIVDGPGKMSPRRPCVKSWICPTANRC